MAKVSGTLAGIGKTSFDKDGYLVAGGGGGTAGFPRTGGNTSYGGSGGGSSGGSSSANYKGVTNGGGSQTGGNAFGVGGSWYGGYNGAGGGGGYYGGYCRGDGTWNGCGAGGGSGWIGGVPEIVSGPTTYSPSTSNGVNSGNGYAKITFKEVMGIGYYNDSDIDYAYVNGEKVILLITGRSGNLT